MLPGLDVRSDGSLVLTLAEGCLQTTLRHAYRALAGALLDDPKGELPRRDHLDLLAELLGREPFAAIRATHPDLASASGARVRVYRDGSGAARWERIGA